MARRWPASTELRLSRPQRIKRGAGVFVLALIVHLIVIGAGFFRESYAEGSSDEARYIFYAESIREGRGMHHPGHEEKPTAYVMPVLPLVFALADPSSLVRLRLLQLIFCALVAVLTFYLAWAVIGHEGAAWLALACLWANLAWLLQPLYLLTEPLYTLLLLAVVAILMLKPPAAPWLIGVGGLLGLAWLTRGALFGSLGLLLIYIVWRWGWRKTALIVCVLLLTITPWVIRNYSAMGVPLSTSTQSGSVLAGAYNDAVYAEPWMQGWVNPEPLYADDPILTPDFLYDEIGYSNYLTERGLRWMRENPLKLPKLWTAHLFGFLRPWPSAGRNPIEAAYQVISWVLGFGLLLYAFWLMVQKRERAYIIPLLMILGGLLTGLLFYAIPRFRLSYAPLFALMEAFALWHLWQRLKVKNFPTFTLREKSAKNF